MFAVQAQSAKTANIYTLEIYPLYGKHYVSQIIDKEEKDWQRKLKRRLCAGGVA